MCDSSNNCEKDMVNLYGLRLKELNSNDKINNIRQQLAQWQEDSHRIINEYYQRKLTEIDCSINQFETDFNGKRSKVEIEINDLQSEQENTDKRTAMINSIENNFNDIEQMSFVVHLHSLTIPEQTITIEKQFHLPTLPNDCLKILYTENSSSAIASNTECLLMHQQPYLLLLDHDLKIVKQNLWSNDWIRDMCWSKTINSFIVITDNQIYFIDQQLQISPAIQHDFQQHWFSCTCSSQSLFLSTYQWDSTIYQFHLDSSLTFAEQWKQPSTCEQNEGINDIQCNHENIALMIQNPRQLTKRMVLKSLKTFSTIWSLDLSVGPSRRLFTCSPINTNEWLVIDGTNCHIYQVNKDGQFTNDIAYDSVPYRANLFASNILVVAAETHLNLYRIAV